MAFENFQLSRIDVGEATLRVRHGGSGQPLLLLHGYPETHMMWGKIADDLAKDFTVVAPDLRGYGESSKPAANEGHESYSKRAMARDAVALMEHLGFARFDLAGHDRGGRVGYRLALDYPQAAPPTTSQRTRPIAGRPRSPPRSRCCGARAAPWRRGTTCSRSGGSGPTTSRATPSTAATSSPRNGRRRPWRRFEGSS